MRQKRIIQGSLFDLFSNHQIGRELKAISAWLDARTELLTLVAADVGDHGPRATGRRGLPAESVLPAGRGVPRSEEHTSELQSP